MLDKLLPFLMKVVDRYGVKPLVAVAICGGMYYMAMADKVEGWIAILGGCVVAVAFFAFRDREQTKKLDSLEFCDGGCEDKEKVE